jgi:hypothetical protein
MHQRNQSRGQLGSRNRWHTGVFFDQQRQGLGDSSASLISQPLMTYRAEFNQLALLLAKHAL